MVFVTMVVVMVGVSAWFYLCCIISQSVLRKDIHSWSLQKDLHCQINGPHALSHPHQLVNIYVLALTRLLES